MKTLNINKLTILIGLFFVSVFFTTSANALCTVNGDGAIVVVSGNSSAPVSDDTSIAGEYTAGDAAADCFVTPAIYKLSLYKFGICTADPDMNDISSCQLFFDQAAGVEVDIQAGVSATLPIPEFYIEPGSYPYMYVLISNKLGMKWTATMSNNVTGADKGGTAGEGTTCWTTDALRSNVPQGSNGAAVTTVHGTSITASTKTIDCGSSLGSGYTFANEVMTRFIEADADDNPIYCSAALAANGDKVSFPIEGTGATRGIPTINLLTSTDVFATSCQNSAKIAWTTALSTPYTITEDSKFTMSIKATAANTIEFSDGSDNNAILKIISGAPRIYLNID